MQNAIAQASKLSVAALIGCNAPMMPKTVHLHDEPNLGREEVNDVAIQRNLTPEGDSETLTGEVKPER